MLPMWASYIVKAYSWTVILAKGGIVYWLIGALGLNGVLEAILALPVIGGSSLSTSNLGRFLVFTYIWLPFMILPIQAALERVPPSLLQASSDLGATPAQTFRTVLLPLAFPGVVAGSIFTFSLTLGELHHPHPGWAERLFHRQYGLHHAGLDREYPHGRRIYRGAHRDHYRLPGPGQTSGSFRCALIPPAA